MYEIVEARERTIADLASVAQREYGFRDPVSYTHLDVYKRQLP